MFKERTMAISAEARDDFVEDFRPSASFLFGAACAASGLDKDECLTGAGAENTWSSLWTSGGTDTSGKGHNSPQNASNIENGWSFYGNSVSVPSGASSKTKGHGGKFAHPTSAPLNNAPAPAAPTPSEHHGVPDPPGSVSSGPFGPPLPWAADNYLNGMPSPVGLLSSPDRPPFYPYGNTLAAAPPGQADTANALLMASSSFNPPPAQRDYPPSPENYLASPPTFFQDLEGIDLHKRR